MRLRSNKNIQHNPGLFDSLNTSVSSTELCSDSESEDFNTESSLEEFEKMREELKELINDQTIPVSNTTRNIKSGNINIQISPHAHKKSN